VLTIVSPTFRRNNTLWIAWFALAYLTFSFYDNRLARHSTFWWPSWVALAAACLEYVRQRVPSRFARILPFVFVVAIPWQLGSSRHQDYSDFREQRPLVASLFANGNPGNVLLLGADKQTFVELIREYDHERLVHVLRGDALLNSDTSLQDICRRYRIGKVLVALSPGGTSGMPNLAETVAPLLRPFAEGQFLRRGQAVRVLEYDYVGPVDPVMADVPLSGKLL
jgi:hypothetical protein